MKREQEYNTIIIIGLATAAFVFWLLTRGGDQLIVYRLPEGFEGEFQVVDSANGVTIDTGAATVVLDVPPSGRLLVSSRDFLTRWHKFEAVYPSGKRVPPMGYGTTVDGLSIFSLGSTDTTTTYLVGTERDYDAHYERLNHPTPPGPRESAEPEKTAPTPQP